MIPPPPDALRGLFPVVPTPLTADDAIDHAALAGLVEFLLAAGVDGLVAGGSTSEAPYLSTDERLAVIATVCETAAGRVPVIAGSGTYGTRETCALSRAAAARGAAALLVLVPMYFRVPFAEILAHYRRVAEAVDRPVLYYHLPAVAHWTPDLDELTALAALPELAGAKVSVPQTAPFEALRAGAAGRPFALFSGTSLATPETVAAGATGVICLLPLLAPEAARTACGAALAGRFDESRAATDRLFELLPLLFDLPVGPPLARRMFRFAARWNLRLPQDERYLLCRLKECLRQRGLMATARVRTPLPQVSDAQAARIAALLQGTGCRGQGTDP